MINIFSIGDYLVSQLIPIKHKTLLRAFGMEDLEDFTAKLSSVGDVCLIAVDGSDIKSLYTDSYKFHDTKYNFIVCKPASSTDTNQLFTAVRDCTLITKEIEGYLSRESENENSSLYRIIDETSFQYNGVGPIGDNFFGSMLTFSLREPFNFLQNPAMWES